MRFRTDMERKAAFSKMNSLEKFSQSGDCDQFSNMNGLNNANCVNNKFSYVPVYSVGDISAMGVDAVGTAGATAVSLVPLVTFLGVGYVGAELALKAKDRLKRQYDSEKHRKKKEKHLRSKHEKLYGRWGE
jgi:hypothetical protein